MAAMTITGSVDRAAAREIPADGPRILVVQPDLYLSFLIGKEVPGARVVEPPEGAAAGWMPVPPPDLVIVEAGSDAERAMRDAPAMVIVRGATNAAVRPARALPEVPAPAQHVLERPFLPSEVGRVVRRALRLEPPRARRASPLAVAYPLAGPLLLAAAVFGVAIVALESHSALRVWAGAVAVAYTVARLFVRRDHARVHAADVAAGALLIALTGGFDSVFGVFALIAVVAAGAAAGPRFGATAGALIAACALPWMVVRHGDVALHPLSAVTWLALFPLAGLAAGHAGHGSGGRDHRARALVEANRVLSELHRIARAMPGGLDLGAISSSVLAEIENTFRAPAAAILVGDAGIVTVAGSYGFAHPEALARGHAGADLEALLQNGARVIPRARFGERTTAALGSYASYLCAPLQRDGAVVGAIVCACAPGDDQSRNLLLVRALAQDASVAIENARLFGRVRELTIDEERHRLARDLHDGIAQSLTHLRLELDYIVRHMGTEDETLHAEMERMARVVERAGNDIREMIGGLRSPALSEGLAAALQSYVRDLNGLGGPAVRFEVTGSVRAPREIESEVFRIAQEGISNAVRHSGAAVVDVALVIGARSLRLLVQDDGGGFDPSAPRAPGSLGISSMQDRARALAASLAISPAAAGGTRLELICSMPGDSRAAMGDPR
jgi:signal transduction histidine kinase